MQRCRLLVWERETCRHQVEAAMQDGLHRHNERDRLRQLRRSIRLISVQRLAEILKNETMNKL
jgi:hypothetical protein